MSARRRKLKMKKEEKAMLKVYLYILGISLLLIGGIIVNLT